MINCDSISPANASFMDDEHGSGPTRRTTDAEQAEMLKAVEEIGQLPIYPTNEVVKPAQTQTADAVAKTLAKAEKIAA